MLEKNQIHEAEITGYTAGGLGVARVEGQVVFVHGAVRGERCALRILKVLKTTAYARVEAILTPAAARRARFLLRLIESLSNDSENPLWAL